MKRKSISDIAAHLGISPTTVSLVLNGKGKEARISEKMIKKVQDYARKVNYVPNQNAVSLRTGVSNIIAVLVADIANPFFAKISRAISDSAERLDYSVMFYSFDERTDKLEKFIALSQQQNVDGLIIAPPMGSERIIKKLVKQKTPLVLIDRYFPEISTYNVNVDNRGGAYNLVKHLLQGGHRNIACLTMNHDMPHMRERYRGYQQAILDVGGELDESLLFKVNYFNAEKEIEQAMAQIIRNESIDAVFYTTLHIGLFAQKFIRKNQVKIPEELGVVSFDYLDAYQLISPPLTYAEQPLIEMSEEAVKLLLYSMTDKYKNPKTITLHTRLVVNRKM